MITENLETHDAFTLYENIQHYCDYKLDNQCTGYTNNCPYMDFKPCIIVKYIIKLFQGSSDLYIM
jgi:hypothetical protein